MLEIAAQARELDTDDRVALRVEADITAEDRDREVVGLEPVAAARQRLLDHIAEQLAAAGRGGERVARQEPCQMSPDLIRGRPWPRSCRVRASIASPERRLA